MSVAAPPPWVKALALPSGQWRFLVTAWGWGPFKNAAPDAPPLRKAAKVRASIRTIGEHSGQCRATAAKQAIALCAAGWMRREENGTLTLASWRAPHVFELETAIAKGLVDRDEAGVLSWPESLDGSPPNRPGVTRTVQGATRPGTTPEPPAVHPRTVQGPTQPPHGSQSSLSSHSSNELKAEEDSADDATPPLSLDERIAATSPAAAVANSMGHPSNPKSWAGIMREAMLDLSLDDDAVIRVLVAWESADRETKPRMSELWYGRHRAWVADVLGLDAKRGRKKSKMEGALYVVEEGPEPERLPLKPGELGYRDPNSAFGIGGGR